MAYELTLPLKRGTLEIEFDDVDELAHKLSVLDVARVERLVADAMRPGRKAAKKAASKKGTAKPAKARKARAKKGAGAAG